MREMPVHVSSCSLDLGSKLRGPLPIDDWPMKRATTTYPPLPKGYVEMSADLNSLTGRSPVMPVPHGAAQRRRNMSSVKKFGQNLLQGDKICLTNQRNGPKIQSKEIISKRNLSQLQPFNKMFSVPLMGCCFCSFSPLLCTIARNYRIGDPAFLCDSESFLYPLHILPEVFVATVVKVTDSWPMCPAFETSTAEDPLYKEATHSNAKQAFDDGPRSFEMRSSDEDDTSAIPQTFPSFHTMSTREL
ncbi:hypothetical protein TNCV_571201 [Trichonephila clavipes]|nr:hypothetical protein TNCV_571201 [Trichonephila clavipes]